MNNLIEKTFDMNILLNILLFYAILIFVNIPAPFIGLNFEDSQTDKIWFSPPGFVIPIVWFVLFTFLGVARHLVLQADASATQNSWLLIGLGILCATYAYYTLGLSELTGISALWFGLVGNIVVIIAAFFVAFRLFSANPIASALVLPICLWTAFATLIVIAELKNSRLI